MSTTAREQSDSETHELLQKEAAFERAEEFIDDASDHMTSSVPVVRQLLIALGVLLLVFTTSYIGTIVALFEKPVADNDVIVEARITPTAATPKANAFDTVEIIGKAAYVWDVKHHRVLFNKNGDEALPIASVTKLMTALVAYELLDARDNVSISVEAIRQDGDSGFSAGEQFTVQNLTDLMLLASSNDGAQALAAEAGDTLDQVGDDAQTFVRAMNIRAEELGLTSTHFNNVTGLDISPSQVGAKGSARDMAMLMEYIIINYPDVLALTRSDETRIYNEEGAYHLVKNTNDVIADIPGLIASKTGYTDLAGGNLVVAFDAGLNRPIVISVLGSTREGRFADMLELVARTRLHVTQE